MSKNKVLVWLCIFESIMFFLLATQAAAEHRLITFIGFALSTIIWGLAGTLWARDYNV